jgi:predicted nucleic acid-binding protein
VAEIVATLIDSSVWIDFTRAKSSRKLKQFISAFVFAPDVAMAEPVAFEVLRYASHDEAAHLHEQFKHLPLIAAPENLWRSAAELGQSCRRRGIQAGAMDLLISVVALHHGADIVTFDRDFVGIADVCDLKVKLLQRPAP